MRPRPDRQRVDVQYAANGRDGLGQNPAGVVKVPCGKDGLRYARVQFRVNGRYVGNMMI